MKRCPECRRDYYDDTLLYCLDDGTALLEGPGSGDQVPTAVYSGPVDLSASAEPSTKLFSGNRRHEPPMSSLAILPFAHLSSDPDDEYFCDGIVEELTNALAKVDDLKVVARTSAFAFKGRNVPISEIGSSLNVQNVVEGSVRKFGDRMRITVQLVDAMNGYHLWSEKFDREVKDLFDVQDEITVSVVKELKSKLLGDSGANEDQIEALMSDLKDHSRDVEAYKHYLRGRYLLNKFTPDDFYNAIECFNQAIEIDRNFAPAYAGLSEAHVSLTEFGPVPPLEGLPRAKEAALKAIELDPNLSEAHGSLALVLQEYDFSFAEAEKEYRIAIELNPNNAIAHEYYGALLAQMGRHAEAEEQCLKAIELDPLSPIGAWFYPMALYLERRYEDAVEQAKRVLELDANFSAAHLILSFIHQVRRDSLACANAFLRFVELCGMSDLAAEARKAFDSDGWEAYLRMLTSVEARSHLPAYFIAANYLELGERDSALWALEDSYARREGMIVLVNTDPRFDPLRDELRFQAVVRNIGFPDTPKI
jgi:adenylate cyclase